MIDDLAGLVKASRPEEFLRKIDQRTQALKCFERQYIERFCRVISIAGLLPFVSLSHAVAQSEFLLGDRMPYDTFDRLARTDLDVSGGVIHLAFSPGEIALPKDKILDWIRTSAGVVSAFYGRFPVSSVKLLFVSVNGKGVRGGTTWGYRGAAIRVLLGRDSSEDDLRRDWVLVHEMVHLALPNMDQRYDWLSEGLAVYVEQIARVQARDLTAKEIWEAMMSNIPKGLPLAGDRGLDNTDTWGRKYWGGAMFCLLADIEIRKATSNRLSLQDAMRGVLAAGGSHEIDWSISRILSTADNAIGLNVLAHLYDAWGSKPVTPDLDALWRNLGLRYRNGQLDFDDTAPLAAIRRSITEPSR